MATLSKMVNFSVFELLILSIFAFIGHWPLRSLEAATGPTFFTQNYTPENPIWQAPTKIEKQKIE